ncbi:MAG TPA: DUF2157 domain-containing protein [Acidimicrobiales bacterium]
MDRLTERETAESLLDRWLERGLISTEQAAAIRAAEGIGTPAPPPPLSAGPPAKPPPAAPRASRAPLVAEVFGYLGAVIALIAAGILIGPSWSDLGTLARFAIVGAATAVAVVLGAVLPADQASLRRLGSLLWALAVAGAGAAAWLATDEWLGWSDDSTAAAAAGAAALLAMALYLARRLGLQLFAFAGSAGVLAAALVSLDDEAQSMTTGYLLLGLGVAWLALAWGGVALPAPAAQISGAVTAGVGAQLVVDDRPFSGLLVGCVLSGAVLLWAILARDRTPLVLGALGLFAFVPQVVFRALDGQDRGPTDRPVAAALAFLLIGVGVVAGAVVLGRVTSRKERSRGT